MKNFGEDILLPTGEIDRSKLGELVFSDSQKRRVLNSCTHPAIHKAMLWKILKLFFQGTVTLPAVKRLSKLDKVDKNIGGRYHKKMLTNIINISNFD